MVFTNFQYYNIPYRKEAIMEKAIIIQDEVFADENSSKVSIQKLGETAAKTVFEALASNIKLDIDPTNPVYMSGNGTVTHLPGGSQAVDDRSS